MVLTSIFGTREVIRANSRVNSGRIAGVTLGHKFNNGDTGVFARFNSHSQT